MVRSTYSALQIKVKFLASQCNRVRNFFLPTAQVQVAIEHIHSSWRLTHSFLLRVPVFIPVYYFFFLSKKYISCHKKRKTDRHIATPHDIYLCVLKESKLVNETIFRSILLTPRLWERTFRMRIFKEHNTKKCKLVSFFIFYCCCCFHSFIVLLGTWFFFHLFCSWVFGYIDDASKHWIIHVGVLCVFASLLLDNILCSEIVALKSHKVIKEENK